MCHDEDLSTGVAYTRGYRAAEQVGGLGDGPPEVVWHAQHVDLRRYRVSVAIVHHAQRPAELRPEVMRERPVASDDQPWPQHGQVVD